MEPMTSRQVVNSWCFPPVNFSSAASTSVGEAPLLAGEARCGGARSYVYTGEPRHWFENAANFCRESPGARRLVCPSVAATRQGKAADGPLTSFLGGGCAIGHLWPGASRLRPAPPNAQTGVRSQLRSQPCQTRTRLAAALLSRPWRASQPRNLSEVQI